MPPQPKRGECRAIDEFLRVCHASKQDCRIETEGAPTYFIPEDKIQKFFASNPFRTTKIIQHLTQGASYRVSSDDIIPHRCLIFAIFLIMGQGKLFLECAHNGDMIDRYLPFTSEPKGFPQGQLGSFFDEFKEQQWPFCPLPIQYLFDNVTHEQQPLPVVFKEPISGGEGAAAKTSKVKIYHCYDRVNRDGTPGSRVYALKISGVREMQRMQGERELEAMFDIRNSVVTGRLPIVQHYSSLFYQNRIYSFQEFADGGSLEDLFEQASPIHSPTQALKMWDKIMALLDGIQHIHAHVVDCRKNNNRFLQGWHQDIKPRNILVFHFDPDAPEESEFKLADFGLSYFRPLESETHTEFPWVHQPYGPPPPQPGDIPHLPSWRDVWATGCIFSEFAEWMENGLEALAEYRWRRAREIKRTTKFDESEAFHNGIVQLDCVKVVHKRLITSTRYQSTMFAVRDVIQPMLYLAADGASAAHHKKTWEARKEEMNQTPDTSSSVQRVVAVKRSSSQLQRQPEPDQDEVTSQSRKVQKSKVIWSYADAWNWKDDFPSVPSPIDDVQRQKLRGRDHVILIDDGSSMNRYWSLMIRWLELVLWLLFLWGLDMNVDYNFFEQQKKGLAFKPGTYEKILREMKGLRPSPMRHRASNPGDVLLKLLDSHGKRARQGRVRGLITDVMTLSTHKPLSIYVLTDAAWSTDETENTIINALEKHPKLREYIDVGAPNVGIQFVQFGDDPEATSRLRRLDHLKKYGAKADIVDTVSWNGDVDKMLFGAINRSRDGNDADSEDEAQRSSMASKSDASRRGRKSETLGH